MNFISGLFIGDLIGAVCMGLAWTRYERKERAATAAYARDLLSRKLLTVNEARAYLRDRGWSE